MLFKACPFLAMTSQTRTYQMFQFPNKPLETEGSRFQLQKLFYVKKSDFTWKISTFTVWFQRSSGWFLLTSPPASLLKFFHYRNSSNGYAINVNPADSAAEKSSFVLICNTLQQAINRNQLICRGEKQLCVSVHSRFSPRHNQLIL